MPDLPPYTLIVAGMPGRPNIHVYRADTRVDGMALKLNLMSAYTEVGTWLSVSQARQLAAALSAHADAFDAQFPAEVAA